MLKKNKKRRISNRFSSQKHMRNKKAIANAIAFVGMKWFRSAASAHRLNHLLCRSSDSYVQADSASACSSPSRSSHYDSQ